MDIFVNGKGMVVVDDLARDIRAGIIEAGGDLPKTENEVLTVFGAYDAGAHVTDTLDSEQLGELLGEFLEAWERAGKVEPIKPPEPPEPVEPKAES